MNVDNITETKQSLKKNMNYKVSVANNEKDTDEILGGYNEKRLQYITLTKPSRENLFEKYEQMDRGASSTKNNLWRTMIVHILK